MYAIYIIVNDPALHKIAAPRRANPDQLAEGYSKESESYFMEQLWDGLHFLLTGLPGGQPDPKNPLSQATAGARVLHKSKEDEPVFRLSCIESGQLDRILKAMSKIQIASYADRMKIADFVAAGVTPDIWREERKAFLWEELQREFQNLQQFYKKARREKANILIRMYDL